MSLKKHFASNLLGAIVPMVIALLTIPLYIKVVGVDRYGVLAIVWATLGYFSFLDMGVGKALTQKMAKSVGDPALRSELMWTALCMVLVFGGVGGVVLWNACYIIFDNYLNLSSEIKDELFPGVFYFSLSLPLLFLTSVLNGGLQARLKYFQVNLIQVISGALGQVTPLVFALIGYQKLHHLILAVILGRLISTLLLFKQCVVHIPLFYKPKFSGVYMKEMLSYGGWVSIIGLLWPFLVTIDRFLIGSLKGPGFVSYYSVPYDLVTKYLVFVGSLSTALFPRMVVQEKKDALIMASRTSGFVGKLGVPIIICGIFISDFLMAAWIGNDFLKESSGVAQVLMLGVWFNSVVAPFNSRFMAQESPKKIVFLFLAEIPIYIAAIYYFVEWFGVLGAAIAWVLRVAFDSLFLLYLNNSLIVVLRNTALGGTVIFFSLVSWIFVSDKDLFLILFFVAFLFGAYTSRSVYFSVFGALNSFFKKN